MLVTTSYEPSAEQLEQAHSLAGKLGGRLVPRRQMTLAHLRQRFGREDGEEGILVITKERLEYHHGGRQPLFFHPSTASIRIKRLNLGERDPLLELCGIKPGDRVLDCTAGLGSDAIVFSHAVGPLGAVTALESALIPGFLLSRGVSSYQSDVPGLNEAMRRIDVRTLDHLEFLRSQPDNSYDIVFFDPMFRKPITESASIRAIRGLADERALSPESVAEARRVARRAVVLKEHRDSQEFERLGFLVERRPSTKIAYGVIRCS
ncbi:Putative SAM-dependent methyltransferase [Paenibacillus sp. UNCCL117]|uniref:class I SAM-dependent methyltransferase n=1 Tax=unclassified Paenibacillus TaxID=185978 RepID=UPI000884104D|nr:MULTISPECIES: class I SAM-dependent methyltransferase [unclassified Paenibacillus]SDC45661.1 Putative SAM-dependent methyltransferase [Paenibacillus sp. cl123]SFW12469.1 Putative SAM-dependent methyltransferase [Paenibacillus sp. UNCCL117]